MRVKWTDSAIRDLGRLQRFLAPKNPRAGARAVVRIIGAGERLGDSPRIGVRVEDYEEREVRRIIVDAYEVRYEITDDLVSILRVWHTREDR